MTQATSSCLEIETGNILWTSSTFTTDTGIFNSNVYNPKEKMFYVTVDTFIEGLSLSDLSNPHFSVENLHSRRRLTGIGTTYGGGKVFTGSFLTSSQRSTPIQEL